MDIAFCPGMEYITDDKIPISFLSRCNMTVCIGVRETPMQGFPPTPKRPLRKRLTEIFRPSASFLSQPPQQAVHRFPPSSELEEVQNGTTVFPVKSFAAMKASTGHAAIPHQIGY